MRWLFQLVLLFFVPAALGSGCLGQSRPSNYDPASHERSAQSSNGFLDFTLGRINRENKDYGQCLSEARRVLLDETIKKGYFWSNLIALALLSSFLVVIIYQQRLLATRELSTAEALVQFEQALAGCQAQLSLASEKNRELAEMLAAARESAARSIPVSVQSPDQAVLPSARTPSRVAKELVPAARNFSKAEDRHQSPATDSGQSTNQMRLFSSDTDLIMKVNSLEQQLAHSQRDNHALRRRIANGLGREAPEQQRTHRAKEA